MGTNCKCEIKRLSALIMVGSLIAAPNCLSAVGGVDESDARVKIYRLLESEVILNSEAKTVLSRLRSSLCDRDFFRVSESQKTTSVLDKKGYKEYNLSSRCEISIDTTCQQGLFFFPLQSDGKWVWTASRIGYVLYLRSLAAHAKIPSDVIGSELLAMEKIIINNIGKKLNSAKRTRKYTGVVGQLGLSQDLKMRDGFEEQPKDVDELENKIAHRWNTYLLTLPKKRQAAVPSLGFDPSCGAGEKDFIVKMSPPNGKLSLISDFDWRVCRRRGVDPWGDSCDEWSSALVGRKISLNGKYKYIATWPNGVTNKSTLDLTPHDGGIIELYGDP